MAEDSRSGRVQRALDELRAGRMLILVDDEDRENEGDLVCAGEKVTPDIIRFMMEHARGDPGRRVRLCALGRDLLHDTERTVEETAPECAPPPP